MLCDSSQDDLVLKLCQHQGQAERPAVPWRVSVLFKIPEEICQPGSSTAQPALCPPKDTVLLTPPYSPKPKYYHLGFSVPKMGSDQMVISGPAVPIPVCSSEHSLQQHQQTQGPGCQLRSSSSFTLWGQGFVCTLQPRGVAVWGLLFSYLFGQVVTLQCPVTAWSAGITLTLATASLVQCQCL